jgi:peptidoglycan-associated lipoprotein
MRRTPYMLIALTMAFLGLQVLGTGCGKKGKPQIPATKKETSGTPASQTPPSAPAPKVSLSASPTAIEMGQSTTLSWDSSNATGVNIDNGIGTVEPSGSRTISPKASTTYRATATGLGGSATAEIRITVTAPSANVPFEKLPVEGNPPDVVQREIKDAFFDYDQYTIRDDARTALLANARLLAKYPGVRITIEGHCDERGSEKYNLALGDRRAISVKDFLTAQGIDGSRVDTISYGKERNFCEEHNEECFQLNRRAHFTIR